MADLLHANDRQGTHPDSWYAATTDLAPPSPPLEDAHRSQVCIVGGGFTGLSAALHLAKHGLAVTLLEAHRAGWGASGRNGGQVGSGQRVDPVELAGLVGAQTARALFEIGNEARELVRKLAETMPVECHVRAGIIHADHRPRYVEHSRELVRLAREEYGIDAIEFLDRDAVRSLIGTDQYHGGLIDHASFHLHPLAFASGLAGMASDAGASIHDNSEVVAIDRDRDGWTAHTTAGKVTADHLLIACNGYLGGLLPQMAPYIMPINNFIAATEVLGETTARGLIANGAAVSDSRFVINYFRLSHDHRLLFGGGETYGLRFPTDLANFVRRPMLAVFPQLADTKIDHAWGGTLAITRHRLPLLRQVENGLWYAGGYSGHGISIGTHSGKLVADAIAGDDTGFKILADLPSARFPGGAAFRAPLLMLAMSWYALRDRL